MVNIDKLMNVFVKFCKYFLKINLYPYQIKFARRVMESIFNNDGAEIASLWARQIGKTETVGCVSLFLLIAYPKITGKPLRIGIFAPKYDQAMITFDRLKARYSTFVKKAPTYDAGRFRWGNSIEVFGGSLVKCISAGEGTTIEGETFDLIITEEVQDISNRKLTKSIFPMGASTAATRVLVGTASFHKCYFWEASERLKGTKDGFFNDWKVAIKYNSKYQKHIDKEIERIGEDSDEFRSQYALEWRLEHGQFITHEVLMEKVMFEELSYKGASEEKTFAGIDVAKSPDSTVLTIGKLTPENNIEVICFLEMLGEDYADQIDIIIDYFNAYNVKQVLVDKVGVGDSFVDLLRRRANRGTKVMGFRWSAISHHNVFRALSYYINKKMVRVPYNDEAKKRIETRKFMEQFTNLEKRYVGNKLKCHHPDIPNAHDDYISSIALLTWLVLGRYNIGKVNKEKPEKPDMLEELQCLNKNVTKARMEPQIMVNATETLSSKIKRLKKGNRSKLGL